jgi:DNA helicase II / ATP-dependent DNA helicase PcrA
MQLVAFAQLAREYAALDANANIAGFRAWLSATVGGEGAEGARDAVALSTFHRAKGLEWPVVFLVGLERGLVPIGRSTDPAEEAEERRLLYVAATRAEQRLHCSWAERRSFGPRSLPRQPSPYLEAVEIVCLRLQGREPEADDREAGLRRARSALPRTGRPVRGSVAEVTADADPAVLSALRQWRSTTAKASGVPAYVIFHDSTLAALAASCPSTTKQLLGLPGLGPVKVSRYGDALLELVATHRASA